MLRLTGRLRPSHSSLVQIQTRGWKGLLQAKAVQYTAKVWGKPNHLGAHVNKFWNIRAQLPVRENQGNRIPQINDVGKYGSHLHPNMGLSNMRMSRRIGLQGTGKAHQFHKVHTSREIDPLKAYYPSMGLNIGRPTTIGGTHGKPVTDDAQTTFSEKILKIERDGMQTGFVMLVAGDYRGASMRWQIAPHGVQVGDVLTTTTDVNDAIAELKQGNTHPLATLPIGTPVCLIQGYSHQLAFKNGLDSFMKADYSINLQCRQAGAHSFIVKHDYANDVDPVPSHTFLYNPWSKRTTRYNASDIATLGRVSNPTYLKFMKNHKSLIERWYLGRKNKGKGGSGGKGYMMGDMRYQRGSYKYDFKNPYVKPITPSIHGGPVYNKTGKLSKNDKARNQKSNKLPHISSIDAYVGGAMKRDGRSTNVGKVPFVKFPKKGQQ